MKYAYPVKKMCQWLTVSPSGFFDWKRREISATARRRAELTALVVEIFTDSDETYGYRRVHAELGRRGNAREKRYSTGDAHIELIFNPVRGE